MAITRPVTKTIISTTGWGVPITDEVNALRAALIALQPSPWTAPTLQSGWQNEGGGQQVMQYRKVADIVQLRGVIRNGTMSTLFTLPANHMPPMGLRYGIFTMHPTSGAVSTARLDLQTTGVVSALNYDNTHILMVNATYSVTA